VAKITETLNRLNCLLPLEDDINNQQLNGGGNVPRKENLYIAMNEMEEENKQPKNENIINRIITTKNSSNRLPLVNKFFIEFKKLKILANPKNFLRIYFWIK